jgi:hypothetical protein
MADTRTPVQVEKLLYRRKDVAHALSLSLRTVDTMISNRVFTTRRIGGCVVIPAQEVKRFAAHVLRCDMLDGTAPKSRRA